MDYELRELEQLIELDDSYLPEFLRLHLIQGGFDYLLAYYESEYLSGTGTGGWLPINVIQSTRFVDAFEMNNKWAAAHFKNFLSNYSEIMKMILQGQWVPELMNKGHLKLSSLNPLRISLEKKSLEAAFLRSRENLLLGFSVINLDLRCEMCGLLGCEECMNEIPLSERLPNAIETIYGVSCAIRLLQAGAATVREIWPAKKINNDQFLLLSGKRLAMEDIAQRFKGGPASSTWLHPWVLPVGQFRDMRDFSIIRLE